MVEDEDANLPVHYAFIPYQELVILSKAKESLEKQLSDLEEQVSKLKKPISPTPTPAALGKEAIGEEEKRRRRRRRRTKG